MQKELKGRNLIKEIRAEQKQKNPQCRIYGGDVLPDEENNCSLCGGLMNEFGECQGKRNLPVKHE